MAEDSASVIRKLFDAFNTKDIDAIAALAADDYVLIDCASGEKYEALMVRGGTRRDG